MALEGRLDAVVDGTVEFSFSVTNADTEPIVLRFRSGLVADVAVLAGDEVVWRWSEGRAFTQALGAETLLPGESFVHSATWDDPDRGEYEAVASLEATNVDLESRTSVVV